MAFLFLREENLYVIHGETTIISQKSGEPVVLKNPELKEQPSDNKTTEEMEVDENECEEKTENTQETAENNLAGEADNDGTKGREKIGVIYCALSTCGQLLAVVDNAKRLIIWEHKHNQEWKVISCRITKRKCITLSFCQSSQLVLVADRAGDVYSYSISQPQEPGKLMLGHLSMLLDMVISHDEKFVITSDRDEKIRVSHFPNTYNIHCYCLGHSEFVSSLKLYSKPDWLLSGSGDGTLRVWNYQLGKQLCAYSYLPNIQPILSTRNSDDSNKVPDSDKKVPTISRMEVAEGTGLIAVLFDKLPCVGIYHIIPAASEVKLEHKQLVVTSSEPWDLKLSPKNEHLLVLAPTEGEILTAFQFCGDEANFTFERHASSEGVLSIKQMQNMLNQHWDSLKECKKKDDYQHLYKQWFDNMKTYLEKKELREKEKQERHKKKFKKLNLVKT